MPTHKDMSKQELINQLQRLENRLRDGKLGPRQTKAMMSMCHSIKEELRFRDHTSGREERQSWP